MMVKNVNLRANALELGLMMAHDSSPPIPFSVLSVPGAFAEQFTLTPAQTEGPFYPDKLPLDTDNDLFVVNENITRSVGEVTSLSGRILKARGEPIRNAQVEIWQVEH